MNERTGCGSGVSFFSRPLRDSAVVLLLLKNKSTTIILETVEIRKRNDHDIMPTASVRSNMKDKSARSHEPTGSEGRLNPIHGNISALNPIKSKPQTFLLPMKKNTERKYSRRERGNGSLRGKN